MLKSNQFARAFLFLLPRVVDSLCLIARPDEKRKEKRQKRLEKKERERKQRLDEKNRLQVFAVALSFFVYPLSHPILQNLKKEEIAGKLRQLQKVSGMSRDKVAALVNDDEFDPEAWDKQMAAMFDDAYYAQPDFEKPDFGMEGGDEEGMH